MKDTKRFSWDFWSIVILLFYALIPMVKWPNLPQHIDIYYHLLTAWGFIKAGGYTNWDFWTTSSRTKLCSLPCKQDL